MAETKAESGNILGTEKLGTLLRKFAVPNVIALLVAALYNIVDQLFIANASYLGSYGNAANTVVYPMTVIALALAVMVGDGTCTFMSLSLGKGNREDANKSVGNAIVAVLVISVILTALYFIFMNPLLNAFGGRVNAQTFEQSKIYFTWIAMGIPGYMFGQAMNSIIRGDGSPKFAMAATLAGAVVNIIFDPIFIFGMKWGMMGAAIATIMGQYLTAALSIWYLFHLKTVTLKASGFRPDQRILKNCTINGITSFLAQISLVAAMLAMQNMVVKYGGMDPVFGQEDYAQIPMAVLGIVMKFFQIVISIAVGVAAGCIPIAGYNMGAGRKDRVQGLFRMVLLIEFLVGCVALCIVEFLPRQLIGLFGAANESSYYTDFAIRSFRLYLCMMPLATVNKGTFIYLQGMGKAFESTLLSMLREIV
ncbi:MAG TPA: MATE family efflux transporter, partial [Lachnospiraceae bacterium]|nr:MATE family efflux transporter [Lachnospiraceae bacterium]